MHARLAALTRERDELAAGNPNIQSHFALLKEIEANRVRFVEVLAERDYERARAEKARGDAVEECAKRCEKRAETVRTNAAYAPDERGYRELESTFCARLVRALAHDEGRETP